jgi:hypothetical protein
MSTKASREVRGREGSSQQVGGAQEGLLLSIESSDQDVVPERVELGSALIEDFGEIGVEILGVELVAMC